MTGGCLSGNPIQLVLAENGFVEQARPVQHCVCANLLSPSFPRMRESIVASPRGSPPRSTWRLPIVAGVICRKLSSHRTSLPSLTSDILVPWSSWASSVPASWSPFPLLLSHPEDQHASVIVHLLVLTSRRSRFTSIFGWVDAPLWKRRL